MNFETLSEAVDAYVEILNESGAVSVCGSDFMPSDILLHCDPVMFRCGFHDWIDGEDVDSDTLEGDDYRL